MILKSITKNYKIKNEYVCALDDINIEFPDKGMVFILGKSGSGKSTLLNILGGLDKPSSGELIIDNENLYCKKSKALNEYRKNKVGFIFQEYNLINSLTVEENINIVKKEDINLYDILYDLDILELKDRKVNELSGGQAQRVAIARALAKDPSILLCDEPTGALDSVNSEQLFSILKKISKEKLVIVVSHDEDYASKYEDYRMTLSDGKVICNNIKIKKEENIKSINENKISNKLSFKLGLKYLLRNKLGFIFSFLVLIISLTFSSLFYCLRTNDITRARLNDLYDQGVNYLNFSVSNFRSTDESFDSTKLDDDEKLELVAKELSVDEVYTSYIMNFDIHEYFMDDSGYVSNVDLISLYKPTYIDFFDVNLLFGSAPSKSKDIIISEEFADVLIKRDYSYETLEKEINIYDDLLGLSIDVYTIVGVYSTNNNLIDFLILPEDQEYAKYRESNVYLKINARISEKDNIYKYNKEKIYYRDGIDEDPTNDVYLPFESLFINYFKDDFEYDILKNTYIENNFTQDEITNNYDYVLDKTERYFADELFNRIEEKNVRIWATSIAGEDYEIAGLHFMDYPRSVQCLVSEEIYEKYSSPPPIKTTSNKYIRFNNGYNIDRYIMENMFEKDFTIEIKEGLFCDVSCNTSALNRLFPKLHRIYHGGRLFGYISAFLLVLSISIVILSSNNNINKNIKDIGVLKSLGSSKKRIFSVLYLQNLIYSIFSTILGLILGYVAVKVFNSHLLADGTVKVNILFYNPNIIPFVIMISLIIPLLCSLFSLLKLTKKESNELFKY